MVNDRTKKSSTSQARFLLRKRNNERQPLDSFKRTDKRFNWINCQSIKKNRDMTRWPFLRRGPFLLSTIGGCPMKCQRKYQWVKLPRNCLPQGKGVLGQAGGLSEGDWHLLWL